MANRTQFLCTTAAQRIMQEPVAQLFQPNVALKNIRFLMYLSRQNGSLRHLSSPTDVSLALEEILLYYYFNYQNTPMRCVFFTYVSTLISSKIYQSISFSKSLPSLNSYNLIFYLV